MTKTTRMIEQECYKADDGRVFDTIEQCWLYEKQKQTDETLVVCRPCGYDQPCDMFYRTSEHDSTSTEEVLRHEDDMYNNFLFSLGSSSREVSMKSDWLIRTLARLDYASDLLPET